MLDMPDWAFLIKHKDRVVLWDTGLSPDLSIYPPATKKRMPQFRRKLKLLVIRIQSSK